MKQRKFFNKPVLIVLAIILFSLFVCFLVKPQIFWKTYTNHEESFSFRYPNNFTIKKVDRQSGIYDSGEPYTDYRFRFTTGVFTDGVEDWSGFLITVGPANGKTIQEVWEGQPGWAGTIVHVVPVPVNNGALEAAKVINTMSYMTYRKNDKFYNIAPFQNGNSFKADNILNHIDQIISTLRFQENKNSVPFIKWKTYADKVFGISFKYPESWNVSAQAPGSDYYLLIKNFISKSATAPLEKNQILIFIGEGLRDPSAHSVKLKGIDTMDKLTATLSSDKTQTITEQKASKINGYETLSRTVTYQTNPDKAVEEIYILDEWGKVIIITHDGDMSSFKNTFDQILSTFKFN